MHLPRVSGLWDSPNKLPIMGVQAYYFPGAITTDNAAFLWSAAPGANDAHNRIFPATGQRQLERLRRLAIGVGIGPSVSSGLLVCWLFGTKRGSVASA